MKSLKSLAKLILPKKFLDAHNFRCDYRAWKTRNYQDNSPRQMKWATLLHNAIPNAVWVETGTHLGDTTDFLADRFPHVHTIEPSPTFYEAAYQKFKNRNVTVYHSTSVKALPNLLSSLQGPINYWLDGHFSGRDTYRGPVECPVIDELKIIERQLGNLGPTTIFIDDVRCFLTPVAAKIGHPDLNTLVEWGRSNNCYWDIRHDILIMRRHIDR